MSNKAIQIVLNFFNSTTKRLSIPIPEVGTKYICGNYEYSYGEALDCNKWTLCDIPDGWGVRIIDKSQVDYVSPLTVIQGHPVTNMSYLFYYSPVRAINLINWNTSNVKNMQSMFYFSEATRLNLNSFDTSKVTTMRSIFDDSRATSLNLSSFDTHKLSSDWMFAGSEIKNIIAKTQADSNKYNWSYDFPRGVTVTLSP